MRILSRAVLVSSFTALSLLSFTPLAFADHASDVLGASTDVSSVQFPGLAAGPGFILPDSALYPVDELVQELRLVLAFVPEQQAVVQKNILGERIAEAKVEIGRGNLQATNIALTGAERASRGIASSLSDAAANGRGSAELAREINQTLEEYRAILNTASSQAPTSLAYRLDSTSQVLLEAKVRVEDELPGDELANAVSNDMQSVIDREVLGVQTSSTNLLNRFSSLDAQSSLSARQRMEYEQMMASKSGTNKEKLEKRKKALQEYEDQKKKLQDERNKIYAQIKLLILQLQTNQKSLQQLQKMKMSLENTIGTPTPSPAQ